MRTARRLAFLGLAAATAVVLYTPPANVTTPGLEASIEALQTRIVDLERDNAVLRAHLEDFAKTTLRTEATVADVSAWLGEHETRIADHEARLDSARDRLEARPVPVDDRRPTDRTLSNRVDELADLLVHFRREGDDVIVEGANLHIRNGAGGTDTTNGVGNLIVGYNESRQAGDRRDGSHYVVLGSRNNFRGFGGIVAGRDNDAAGDWASILGGRANSADGPDATIVGGNGNRAGGPFASVLGGVANQAFGEGSAVAGGGFNVSSGRYAVVGGGMRNEAAGEVSVVSRGCDTTVATCGGD